MDENNEKEKEEKKKRKKMNDRYLYKIERVHRKKTNIVPTSNKKKQKIATA